MLTESAPRTRPFSSLARRLWQSLNLLVAPEHLSLTIIVAGIFFRIAQYLFNRSLWVDEVFLALNIRERNFEQLLRPLDNSQASPIGFVLLVKTATTLGGNNELAVRFVPFLFGVASVPLFYFVARRLVRPGALPIALVLFAVSDSLIYYSSELKQYSGDATSALLLYLFIYLPLAKPGPVVPLKLVGAGAVGALLIWVSHPSIFVLAGIGVVLLAKNLLARNWRAGAWLLAPYVLWVASFGGFYIVSLQITTSNVGLLNYHDIFFMPMPPLTPANLTWLVTNFFYLFENPGALGLAGLGAFCFLIGGFVYYKRQTANFWVLTLPILFALAASGFHKYSFDGRLLLFLLPALYMLVAEGAFEVHEVTSKTAPVIGIVLVVILLAVPVMGTLEAVAVPRTKEEIRPVLTYYQANRQTGDLLYAYYGAVAPVIYYRDEMNLGQDCCILGQISRDDWRQYTRDLDKLKGKKRVWVVLSHMVNNEETFFKYYLDANGKELDSREAPGAILYLYDLSDK